MKVSSKLVNFMIKVVAFATAFTVLYDFVKDLGEIAVHIYHLLGFTVGSLFLFSNRRKDNGWLELQ